MSDLRILTVIESLGRGGAEQSIVNIVPALQARGLKCDVAALWPPYPLAENLEAAGVTVHRLNLNHRWNLAQAIPRLVRLCRRHDYHVINAHLFFAGFYTALTKPLVPSPRRVVTFQNMGYDSYPANTAWRKVRKQLDAWLLRHWIDKRIAVSAASAESYQRHLKLPPVTVIPNPIALDDLPSLSSRERSDILAGYDFSPEDYVILFCGRLVHEKGHRYFLQALELLHKRNLFPRALIVGDGPLAADIAADVEQRQLQGQVRIQRALPHSEILRHMQAADLLVMSSTHEGFPLAPGEAMSLERPVLATRVGGLSELIEDGVSGVLVPSADPVALAEKIAHLMNNPAMSKELGQAGRRRIEEHFSTTVVAARLEHFYRQLPGIQTGN